MRIPLFLPVTMFSHPSPNELRKSTLGKQRLDDNPLILAATKSIIGHTEGSAGVAGIWSGVGWGLKAQCGYCRYAGWYSPG